MKSLNKFCKSSYDLRATAHLQDQGEPSMSLVAGMYTVKQTLALCLSVDRWILGGLKLPALSHGQD